MNNCVRNKNIIECASKIWNYHLLDQKLTPCKYICVFCSNDLRIADWSAQLYNEGHGETLIFSGGIAHRNDILNTGWNLPEARVFAQRAIELGVPASNIIEETESKNSGENVANVRAILEARDDFDHQAIIVQKPFMQRRTFATLAKVWPELKACLSSPVISFLDYNTAEIDYDTVINTIVGDLHRIIVYPKMGFQIQQSVPDDVLDSFNYLVDAGYTLHLVR